MDILLKLDRWFCGLLRVLSVALLCFLFLLMSLNVTSRFFPFFTMGWFDEIVELSFAWMVFATAAYLWRKKAHPSIDMMEMLLQGRRAQFLLLIAIELVNIFFLGIFTWYAISLVGNASASSPIFQISRKIFYVILPVSGAYMTTVSVFFLIDHIRKLLGFTPPSEAASS